MQKVLWSLLVILVVYAVVGDKPWSGGLVERAEEGKNARPIDYWVTYAYWVIVADAFLLAMLLRFEHLWHRPGPTPRCQEFAPPETRLHRFGWLLVALAIATSATLAYPRLEFSLWDDEENTVRNSVAGYYYLDDDDGSLRYHKAGLRDTLFSYSAPNNHIVHNLVARAVTKAWPGGGEDRRPSLFALRLPSFVFGATSLVSLAYFMWRIGFPLAGVFGAWFLALHPWHIKYASEARAYSLVFTLIPLVWVLCLNALHHGNWRRWTAFGGAQFVLLWAYPAAAYLLVATNLLTLGAILTQHRDEVRVQQVARWFTVNLLGAMAWGLLMAGNIAQFLAWLERKGFNDLGARFLKGTFSYFLAGMPWSHSIRGHKNPVYPELIDVAVQTPWLFYGAVVGTLGLVLLGTLRLLLAADYRRWLPLLLLLPGPVTWFVAFVQGQRMYAWYLIFVMPSLAALLGLGATWLFRRARPSALSAALGMTLCVAYLAGLVAWTAAPRTALRSRSLQPYLESVILTRGNLDLFAPGQDEILTVSFADLADYFDPRVRRVETKDELLSWMERADREGKSLYVNYGNLRKSAHQYPELAALVETADLFELVGHLHGFMPRDSRKVYRYRPGSLAVEG